MSDEATQAVFERVMVQPSVNGGGDGGAALLSWRGAIEPGQVVQVYVNGRLHEVVRPGVGEVGELWLHLAGLTEARVELLAVAAGRAWEAQPHLLGMERSVEAKAAVAVVRDEALPIDSRVIVEVDGERVAADPLWGAMDGRGGFGGLFGVDPFGLGTATAVGHGLGAFGEGAFGAGGRAWRWERDDLPAGEYAVAVRVADESGEAVTDVAQKTVTVTRQPHPPQQLALKTGALVWK